MIEEFPRLRPAVSPLEASPTPRPAQAPGSCWLAFRLARAAPPPATVVMERFRTPPSSPAKR